MALTRLRVADPARTAATDPDAVLDQLHLAVTAGAPHPDPTQLPQRCRRAVELAERIGAPLLPTVEAARAAQDDQRRAERAVTVASAQTRVVAGGLLLAPLVLVPGLARLVGADLVGFYTSGTGLVVLAVGLALLLVGAALVMVLVRRVGRSPAQAPRRDPLALGAGLLAAVLASRVVGPVLALPTGMVVAQLVGRRERAQPPPGGVDEVADLVATALTAGVSGPQALRLVADALPAHAPRLRRLAFGLELGMTGPDLLGDGRGDSGAAGPTRLRPGGPTRPRPAGQRSGPRHDDPLLRLAALLAAAERSGAPVAASVRDLARRFRADDLARILAAAERLPAQLTFPTALCLLPATVLLIGAPIVHTGLLAVGP